MKPKNRVLDDAVMRLHGTVLTLYPEMFPGHLGQSLAGTAREAGLWGLETVPLRSFGQGVHQTVDDRPFGGGAGMVLKPDVVAAGLDAALALAASKHPAPPTLIYMTPRGAPLTQRMAEGFAQAGNLVILCGRFEGVDQRVVDQYQPQEVSIGDYVLSGGEPAALILLDACIRLLPGVMGEIHSAAEESFASDDPAFDGLLEYPHYTRPAIWEGREAPPVLLSGNHAEIMKWRLQRAEEITMLRRSDLWAKRRPHQN